MDESYGMETVPKPTPVTLRSAVLSEDLEREGPLRNAAIESCGRVSELSPYATSRGAFPEVTAESPAHQFMPTGSRFSRKKLTTCRLGGVVEVDCDLDAAGLASALRATDVSDTLMDRVGSLRPM